MATATNSTIQVGPITVDFLVEAEDSNGSVTVFECIVPADSRVPAAHSHDGFEETVYVLEGTCTWTIDGEQRELGRGESVCIRRGQVHGFDNRGHSTAKFLAVASPGVFGPAYFRDMNQVLAAAAGGPPDLAAVAEVMRRHGLTPAKPAGSGS
jgi:quercetin dioxygenase-like cupin family protein